MQAAPRSQVLTNPAIRRAGRDGSASVPALVMALAAGAAPALILAIVAVRGGTNNPWILPLAALTVIANVAIVAMNIRYGLALFIVTAGMSPKLPGIYDNLRVEDFVFVLVFGMWLFQSMQAGRLPAIRSPILMPFLLLTVVSVLSTIWGGSQGMVPDLKYSFFLQAKRIEYFLIFWVVTSTIKSEAWLRLLTQVFVFSGTLAAMYGIANPESSYGQSVTEERVMGPEGENYNTLAGYLVVCIGLGLSCIAGMPKGRQRLFVLICTSITTTALLMTFSREGYIMLLGAVLVFGFTKYRAIVAAAAVVALALFLFAAPVRDNVNHTISTVQKSQNDDPGSNSLTARYRTWEYRWHGWFMKQPLVGCGVGSVALSCDNEYLLRACEVGIVGFSVFLWWLAVIGKQVIRLQKIPGLPRVLAVGLAAAFLGLLIQATVAASFTSIRTMEPFWFLLGLVTAATAIHRQKVEAEVRNVCVS
jgi:hypothetical protein